MVSNFREKASETPSRPDVQTPEQPSGRGGKSSNAAFEKTTLYLQKDVKLNAQRQLLGTDEDLSTLMNRLLSEWLNS